MRCGLLKASEDMAMTFRPVNAVVLCGGRSSRMGTAKHLLPAADGKPMYIHLLTQIAAIEYPVQDLFVSVRDPEAGAKLDGIFVKGRSVGLVYDTSCDSSAVGPIDVGPAAGLLAAHRHDPTCTWLVLACDYPLITGIELQALFDSFDGRLVCFKNPEGWPEPLIGLWSPEALERLHENVLQGKTGPRKVIEDLNSTLISPEDHICLFNANTRQEWEKGLTLAQERFHSP